MGPQEKQNESDQNFKVEAKPSRLSASSCAEN